ncbi:MAG: adenine nucleotide alpha hydrolase [Candidatus Ruthia sp.]|nr:adenine nucleotide alpha hydrolase [Candidatus Ruthturnera sp.]
MTSKRTLLSWSSGKDSAYALHLLLKDPSVNLLGLFTTVNKEFERVAMHAVRLRLLKEQAKRIGLPIHIIEIPFPCSNADYEKIMSEFITKIQANNIEAVAFGDLYLEDIRDYRVAQMQGTGIDPIFPCWGIDTKELSQEIISIGIKANITCIDPKQISPDFAGHAFDQALLNELPSSVDSCGENGEFHTFVYDSPDFSNPIDIAQGETIERDGFVFTDWQ